MDTRRPLIRVAAILAASAAVGVLIATGVLWFALELDDGAHDLFGPHLPAADYRVRTHPPELDRPRVACTAPLRCRSVNPDPAPR